MLNTKIRSIAVLLCCFLLTEISASAQNLSLERFSGRLINKRYYISFTLASGFTCYGVIVERSTDGQHYEEVGKLNGWCGHISNSVSYQFIDENPQPNKINFYRLQLGEEFNSRTTTSSIQFEYVTYDHSGVTVIREAQNYFKIFIRPHSAEFVTIELYDLTGRLLFKNRTEKNYYELRPSPILSTIVILKVSNQSNILYCNKFHL